MNKKLEASLDKVFSQYIRLRDTRNGVGICCSCGKLTRYEDLDAGHYLNRWHKPTKWREDNVHAQCRKCNSFVNSIGGYKLFMVNKYGEEHVEYLESLKNSYAGFTDHEIQSMIKEYRKKVKELQNDR